MKKFISVCMVLVIMLSCVGVFSASATEAAEKSKPFIYFETGVETIDFYFWIEDARGIANGDFVLEFDPEVIDFANFYAGDDDYFYWEYDATTPGVIYLSFDFGEGCPLDVADMYIIEFKITGEAHDKTDVLFNGVIDDVEVTFEPYPIEIIYLSFGDVDFDEKITAADARLVLRASVELEELTETQAYLGDIDENGKITAADARAILRYSVGLRD